MLVEASGDPTQFLDSDGGGPKRDTLGGGKGKGEQAPAKGAEASDIPISVLGDDATDTSEAPTGKRERAPVEGVMGSDAPRQSVNKKSRLSDLRPASVSVKEVAKEHAQWWRSDVKGEINSHTRMGPGAPFVLDGEGPVLSEWVAGERTRISGQQLTESEGRAHADLSL